MEFAGVLLAIDGEDAFVVGDVAPSVAGLKNLTSPGFHSFRHRSSFVWEGGKMAQQSIATGDMSNGRAELSAGTAHWLTFA
jgi:hypothetical protein